ncbi:dicarboxylate/amino acid:cation symporter [Wenzhouxiangella marina]|uniref:Sodium:dicarboxylate symporter n=1 Tax=Wenzhouxiangella marina TaxID=1579979 RepID=A0A0K0XTW3_9GAMM|nr:dicarboxylate/amino acid:cation symporter [Wenzhouxiangella marina]AKS41100.1 Sodium:dicarboxylate symporter [Wenzhouxiangella marina]MBB6087979.1 Na+/H+-dicarboxylate symporter [Wenzhouxiangella marina]
MTDRPLRPSRYHTLRQLNVQLKGFVRARLWAQVLIAMALGIVVGVMLGPETGWFQASTSALVTNWLALPGQLFLALVQMIVIPLVFASIVLGMTAGENLDSLRRTGLSVVVFFLATTLVAAAIGIAVALWIQPGQWVDAAALTAELSVDVAAPTSAPNLGDLPLHLVELIPTNPLQAGLDQNMMQVVLMALLVGVALVSMARTRAQPLIDLLSSVQEVTMVVVRWAMFLVPLAVFGLLAQITTRLGLDALLGMSVYVLTVLGGLAVMLMVYLLIYRLLTKRSVRRFMGAVRDVQLLAFSTSSSAAVMPMTIKTAEDRLDVDSSLAHFVIPLGTTINMAGTALYQVVATLFLAQVFQVDVGLGQLLLVAVLAVGASVGSPGTPGIGIVILSMLLGSIGIPAAGVALVIGVDRILDMSRTMINVTGDLVAVSILQARQEAGGGVQTSPEAAA